MKSFTYTTKLTLLLKAGTPSSVTRKVMVLVVAACWRFGVQRRIPVRASRMALVGAPDPREYVRRFAASGSVAGLVNVSGTSTLAMTSDTAANAGGWFPLTDTVTEPGTEAPRASVSTYPKVSSPVNPAVAEK